MIRLEKTNDKNNIYREMKEECFDGEFAKQFSQRMRGRGEVDQ